MGIKAVPREFIFKSMSTDSKISLCFYLEIALLRMLPG